MSKLIWSIIIIALIIVGVFWFTGSDQQGGNQENNNTNNITNDIRNGSVSIKDSPGIQTAVLEAVDGSNSSGTAYIVRENGKLTHLVEAGMPDPGPGNSYEGWLVQTSPLQFFSTGVMSKNSEGLWVLEYETEPEYPSYNRVVITEETVVDATPEKHIIEGDF